MFYSFKNHKIIKDCILIGNVPVNNSLFSVTVKVNNFLLTVSVPVNKFLLTTTRKNLNPLKVTLSAAPQVPEF